MKFKLILIVFLGLLATAGLAATPKEILDGWKKNYGSLDCMEISFTEYNIHAYSETDPNFERKIPSWFTVNRIEQGCKFRASISLYYKEPKRQNIIEGSYDGIAHREYRPGEKEGLITPGKPDPRKGAVYAVNPFKFFILASMEKERPSSMEKMLASLEQDPNYYFSSLGSKTINGVLCEGLKFSKSGRSTPISELWVAVDKGMLPIRYLTFDSKGNIRDYRETLEIADSNGFWYPKKAQSRFKTDSRELKRELVVSKFVRNPVVVDPNIFRLEFPSGTRVIDMRIKEVYEIEVK